MFSRAPSAGELGTVRYQSISNKDGSMGATEDFPVHESQAGNTLRIHVLTQNEGQVLGKMKETHSNDWTG